MMLKKFHFNVDQANCGQSAIEMLGEADKSEPYDVVLMDYRMPNLNGLETISACSGDISCPVILMVSEYNYTDLIVLSNYSRQHTLTYKPIMPLSLHTALCIALQEDSSMIPSLELHDANTEGFLAQVNAVKVLLVEDNEINQEVAKELLENHNILVEIAWDGK
jgi:CheY-like chemotaxis protein